MSEPSSSVPGEIADAQVEEPSADGEEVETVELDVDEEKMEAWNAIKSDYQVDPDAEAKPADGDGEPARADDGDEEPARADDGDDPATAQAGSSDS